MSVFRYPPLASVFTTAAADNAFDSDSPGADTLIVGSGVSLIATGPASGVVLFNTGAWTVKINGIVGSDLSDGIGLAGGNLSSSKISIGKGGQVSGNIAIDLLSAASVTNAGLISGGDGIFINFAGKHTIVNSGTLTGTFWAIIDSGGQGRESVTNSGTINGIVDLAGGNDELVNSGTINGPVTLGSGDNRLTNSNLITGAVSGGDGSDSVANTKDIFGIVNLANGANTLNNKGTIWSDVVFGSGNDTVTNFKALNRDVHLGDGTNKLVNSGMIGIYTPTGVLSLGGNVFGGSGNDTIVNSKLIGGNIDFGEGNNSLINSGTIGDNAASPVTAITFGNGNDNVTNSGRINGTYNILLGDGTNSFTNKGNMNSVVVLGGSGDDTVINSGKVEFSAIFLGDGKNTLINSGTLSGNVVEVGGGSGIDTVTNLAKIGHKTVSGTIFGTINLFGGDDFFTGGNNAETFKDADGLDTVKLGGGNDTYTAVGNTGSDGADKIDGGKGTDTYDARDAINIVKINLDAIEHSAIAANTATGSDVAGAFTDSITGFENAKGGGGADWLIGTAATNTLEGGAGNDTLAGLSGRDILVGGADADSFLFLSIKDSGATAVTRDLIKDFETGDIIDLTGIDANVTNAPNTNDGFAFIGTNVNFDGIVGELRAYWSATGQIVEGDVNGDGKADFSIEIADPAHLIALSASDGVHFSF